MIQLSALSIYLFLKPWKFILTQIFFLGGKCGSSFAFFFVGALA
jgi:hypothetical protein